jgi:acrylyl-CoA reductase (NADPH)
VAPFILRSVKLIGIDSVMAPLPKRVAAWELANELDANKLETITQEIGLAQALARAPELRGAACARQPDGSCSTMQ